MPLPAGFVLDQPQQPKLPQGFVLDNPSTAAAVGPEPTMGSVFADYTHPVDATDPSMIHSAGSAVVDGLAKLGALEVGLGKFVARAGGEGIDAAKQGELGPTVGHAAMRGLANAGQGILNLPTDVAHMATGENLYEPFPMAPASQREQQLSEKYPSASGLVSGGTQFVPMAAAAAAAAPETGGGSLAALFNLGTKALAAGAADYAVAEPTSVPANISNIVNETIGTNLPTAIQPNDTRPMVRAKVALESIPIAGLMEGIGLATKGSKITPEATVNDWAAKAKKPIDQLTVQDVAELARRGDISAKSVLEHPDVRAKMTENVMSHIDAGTINPNSPEFISQLDELTKRVTANSQRVASPSVGAISAADRDAAIRTLWGEARGEGDAGIQAAANVILNRAEKGKESVTDVVRAPKQFSAWDDPRTRPGMDALDPQSADYQRIGAILDKVASGELPDNTGGATHYLNAETLAQEGKALPKWAQGQATATVGRHTFFSPDGAPIQRQRGTIAVTPQGEAIKGGIDAGASASADRQAAQSAAATADVDARMAEAAKNDPLIGEIYNSKTLSPEMKRDAFNRLQERNKAPSNADSVMIAGKESPSPSTRSAIDSEGAQVSIAAQRQAEADTLAEMRATADAHPGVKAILDSGVDDSAKIRVYQAMKDSGQIDVSTGKPLTQGPGEARPFKGFDESTSKSDQEAIVSHAKDLENKAKGVPDNAELSAKPNTGDGVAPRDTAASGRSEPRIAKDGAGAAGDGSPEGRGPSDIQKASGQNEPAVRQADTGDTKQNGQRRNASWVIKNKETGDVVMETYDKAKVDALNTKKYEAVPILDHLQSLNKKEIPNEEGAVSKQKLTESAEQKKQRFADSSKRLREADSVDSWMKSEDGATKTADRLSSSKHGPTRDLGDGIRDVAPEIHALRQDAAGGVVPEHYDIADAVDTAASAVENARAEKVSPKDGLKLVAGDPKAEGIYKLMHNKNMTKLASRDEIATRLGRYVDEASRASEESKVKPEDILQRIAESPDDARGQGHLFDQFDNGAPNREAIKEPHTEAELHDNIESLGGKLEQKVCGI